MLHKTCQFQLHCALDYGGLAVLTDAWDRYGLEPLLAGLGTKRQRGLLQAMVFARLLFPCAKLALAEQAERTALAQTCGLSADESFDEDDLYAAMDLLNGQWVALEKRRVASASVRKRREGRLAGGIRGIARLKGGRGRSARRGLQPGEGSARRLERVCKIPRQPIRRMSQHLLGVSSQRHQLVQGVGLLEPAGVDQAHEQIPTWAPRWVL